MSSHPPIVCRLKALDAAQRFRQKEGLEIGGPGAKDVLLAEMGINPRG